MNAELGDLEHRLREEAKASNDIRMSELLLIAADTISRMSSNMEAQEPPANRMGAEEKLLENGYEGVVYLTNFSYDDALIGVTEDNRAVYDYDLMVEWLVEHEGFSDEEAIEWIDYNTIRALPYMPEGPVILYRFRFD